MILDTVTGNAATPGDSLTSTSAPFGLISVGASPVQIESIGIFGQLLPNGASTTASIRWSIFSSIPNVATLPLGTLVWDSGVQAVTAAAGSTWYDSPVMAVPLTLNAGANYYIGLITDANFLLRYFKPGAVTITGNGLSSPGGNFAGSSGTATNFSSPTLTKNNLTVQVGERVFAPDAAVVPRPVPLPAAGWLFVSALMALRVCVRRQRT
ncbi:MAG: hypothetical protein WCO67_02420 [Betaproteobacteria bacterium]